MKSATDTFAQKKFSKDLLNSEICKRYVRSISNWTSCRTIQGGIALVISWKCGRDFFLNCTPLGPITITWRCHLPSSGLNYFVVYIYMHRLSDWLCHIGGATHACLLPAAIWRAVIPYSSRSSNRNEKQGNLERTFKQSNEPLVAAIWIGVFSFPSRSFNSHFSCSRISKI